MNKVLKTAIVVTASVVTLLSVLVGIGLVLPEPTTAEPKSNTSQVTPIQSPLTAEKLMVPEASDVISETNKYRATKGLAPLTENAQLNQSACLKAQDMVDKDYWSHISPDGTTPWYWFKQAGYEYAGAGENLAYGYATGKEVVTGWINSPTHEANLSGDYTEVGVCSLFSLEYQGDENSPVVAHYGKPR